MKIGTRISPDWLERPEDLRFLKQIGVDCVDITMPLVPGYREAGNRLTREGLDQCLEIIEAAGLKIERINSLHDETLDTFLGRDGSEAELDALAHNAGLCGEYRLPVLGVQCFQANLFGGRPQETVHWIEGRGGSRFFRNDLSDALDYPVPDGAPTHEEIWERTLKIIRTVVPIAESAGIKVAMHGNDPPVPRLWGVPQILYDFDAFDRLFSEVPSPSNGMTFCVGTRYESGEDVFEGIRRFGGRGRSFTSTSATCTEPSRKTAGTRSASRATETWRWPKWQGPCGRSATRGPSITITSSSCPPTTSTAASTWPTASGT